TAPCRSNECNINSNRLACQANGALSSVSVWSCSGEFTSPRGGVKPPLRQTETLPNCKCSTPGHRAMLYCVIHVFVGTRPFLPHCQSLPLHHPGLRGPDGLWQLLRLR